MRLPDRLGLALVSLLTACTPNSSPCTGAGCPSAGDLGNRSDLAGGPPTSCGAIPGLFAYYPLDGDGLDHSGNGHNTVQSPRPFMYTAGKVGMGVTISSVSPNPNAI